MCIIIAIIIIISRVDVRSRLTAEYDERTTHRWSTAIGHLPCRSVSQSECILARLCSIMQRKTVRGHRKQAPAAFTERMTEH